MVQSRPLRLTPARCGILVRIETPRSATRPRIDSYAIRTCCSIRRSERMNTSRREGPIVQSRPLRLTPARCDTLARIETPRFTTWPRIDAYAVRSVG